MNLLFIIEQFKIDFCTGLLVFKKEIKSTWSSFVQFPKFYPHVI